MCKNCHGCDSPEKCQHCQKCKNCGQEILAPVFAPYFPYVPYVPWVPYLFTIPPITVPSTQPFIGDTTWGNSTITSGYGLPGDGSLSSNFSISTGNLQDFSGAYKEQGF